MIHFAANENGELNSKKCEVLHVGKNNPNFAYRVGQEFIKAVPEVNDLGITISATRILAPSMENAIQKGLHAAVNARLHLKNANFQTRVTVWKSYIMPLLEYGAEIWAPNDEKDLYELNKPYKDFFASIQPPPDSNIPFTPSQRVVLLELLALFDYTKNDETNMLDLFTDPANAPKITRSVSMEQLKPLKTISAKNPLLLFKRLSLWNIIPTAVRRGERHAFKSHVEEEVLPQVTGETLKEKLRNGKVQSKWSWLWEYAGRASN